MSTPPLPPRYPLEYDSERLQSSAALSACEPALGAALYCWSDARREGTHWVWQPLVCHGLDAAACADALLARAPEAERRRLAALLGLDWSLARPWLLLLIACHDIGKACPGFQSRWRNLTGIDRGRRPDTRIEPAFVGQIALRELLQSRGWNGEIAAPLTDAVVCHRGLRAPPETLLEMQGEERSVGGEGWADARRGLFEACCAVFQPPILPRRGSCDAEALALLAATTRRADDIASDEARFLFGNAVDLYYFEGWYRRSRRRAEALLDGTEPLPDRG